MPLPLNLFKALEKGEVRDIEFKDSDQHYGPKTGKRWLILTGMISHDDTTASQLFVKKVVEGLTLYRNTFVSVITATSPVSGTYPLFNTLAASGQAQYQLVFVEEDEELWFHGGNTATAFIRVLEWTA